MAHSTTVEELRRSIQRYIRYSMALPGRSFGAQELLQPVSLAIRDRLIDGLLETEERYTRSGAKRLYYLSMEFLMGRWLGDNLHNLGLYEACREAMQGMGASIDEVLEAEPDAGLGNGGLGRLAACFLESLATLGLPGYGYGIDYEYGMFKQEIAAGYQREKPDRWKDPGTPGLIERQQEACLIRVYGRSEHQRDSHGVHRQQWVDWRGVVGVPRDMPVAGWGGRTVNHLRLFAARSSEEFDIEIFNRGDYIRAVEQKIASENISRVLYPSDAVRSGKELRLLQEYFLVACALNDVIRQYTAEHSNFDSLPGYAAIQMNDTHPALAVAELMRLLVDEHAVDWDRAFEITTETLAYTNHTLLPEALEKWPVSLLEYVLPRHMEIIFSINHQFLRSVGKRWPLDIEKQRRLSIIEESDEKHARMAHLAIIGSHSVNGVSKLHSELIKTTLVPDFYQLWPERFNNKTNGVAPRRWLYKANRGLSRLITGAIGEGWITDLDQLAQLERMAGDAGFQSEFMAVKQENKRRLARVIQNTTGVTVDPQAIFDVQIKRIHEYKRQLLNVLRLIADYLRVVEDGYDPPAARLYLFAGKAAPGYWAAKQIIKLINNVAEVVNADERARGLIKAVFVPDYRVSLAEVIMPAADLSQQVSTAGMEASGTGNMKLQMNGALTMGTLDGANIEILEEVGEENIYIFGLRAEEIRLMQETGSYSPRAYYNGNPTVRRVMDSLADDRFCPEEPGLLRWVYDSILDKGDRYFNLADLPSYLDVSNRAENDYVNQAQWARRAILNVARSGKFSSDRTIREYARDIWGIQPVLDSELTPADD